VEWDGFPFFLTTVELFTAGVVGAVHLNLRGGASNKHSAGSAGLKGICVKSLMRRNIMNFMQIAPNPALPAL
jgi:hypothetical protein